MAALSVLQKRKAQRRLEQSQAAMMDEQEQPEDTEPCRLLQVFSLFA